MKIMLVTLPIVWSLLLFMAQFDLVWCKEGVIKNDDMAFWFKQSYGIEGDGEHWTNPSKEGKTYSEIEGSTDSNFWLITKHIDTKLNKAGLVNVDIETQLSGKLEIYVYLKKTKPNLPSFDNKTRIRHYLGNYFKLVSKNDYPPSKKPVRNTKTFTFSQSEAVGVTFGIKGAGEVKGKLWRIRMYYFYCEHTFINSVNFSRTFSPDTGSKEVHGSCSRKSTAGGSGSKTTAFCLSNGSWAEGDKSKACLCIKGYQPSEKQGCVACPTNFFKQDDSNTNCTSCPSNTLSGENRTACKCKIGHFKLAGQINSILSPCYAPLKMDRKPSVNRTGNSTVNITWNKPNRNGNLNETILFDVECYTCPERKNCSEPCNGETFKPGAFNLTQFHVFVSNLNVGTKYEFRVYPKNSLNGQIIKTKWNYSQVEYQHEVVSPSEITTTPTEIISKEEDERTTNSKGEFPLYIILVAVACVLLMVVTFLVVIILRRKRLEKKYSGGLLRNTVELPTTGQRTYIDPSNYDNPEAAIGEFASELDPSNIQPEMLIGGGEFGDVYKGKLRKFHDQSISVALKTLKPDATPKSEKDFLLEASIMGQFNHVNVVHLEGVISKHTPRMIVLEFMANGSLENFLKINDGRLSQIQLVTMAKGIAAGMEYLAAMNYVHRDLAARNILVSETMICKVSDFGLSRHLETTDSSRGEYSTSGGKIPMRWTAPEAIKYRKFSSASDVWSYGILLWEIMSFAERPYWEWDNFRVIEKVDEGYRLPSPLNCPKGVHDLMLHCWKQDRAERPNFTSITTVIDTWLETADTMDEELGSLTLLGQWLKRLKMGSYIGKFTTAGYDKPSQVIDMTDERLKEIGIMLVGHRNKILKGIKMLKNMQKQRELKREISLEV